MRACVLPAVERTLFEAEVLERLEEKTSGEFASVLGLDDEIEDAF